ncbi:NAD-P-binding protein [Trametes versicolor FP-101664 SS1]|uniref:NAD-P-binding protein n=1 Tax=Trametes versicolor (strain FP-101664) TaxID=717944 RepID=UPI0004621B9B|nr:NAD-P-binding protein [Trametes versicolor FP-101664 SS1]EIW54615.1 NAD-P-binding protein [Trametes versicolor FP-101664 SS1]
MSSTASTTTWLVTGANRGIGFELVRQLLSSPANIVLAAVRSPGNATALTALEAGANGTLHVLQLDVSDFDNVRALPARLAPILGDTGLDYLINNAATTCYDTAYTIEPEALLAILRTNTIGPAHLSRVLLPLLERGRSKKILHISSTTGSIASGGADPVVGGRYTAYAMSKAALNMFTAKQALDRPDIVAITLCPGWVKTDMGGANALLEPAESISGILKVITSATAADNGKYFRHNGETIPW